MLDLERDRGGARLPVEDFEWRVEIGPPTEGREEVREDPSPETVSLDLSEAGTGELVLNPAPVEVTWAPFPVPPDHVPAEIRYPTVREADYGAGEIPLDRATEGAFASRPVACGAEVPDSGSLGFEDAHWDRIVDALSAIVDSSMNVSGSLRSVADGSANVSLSLHTHVWPSLRTLTADEIREWRLGEDLLPDALWGCLETALRHGRSLDRDLWAPDALTWYGPRTASRPEMRRAVCCLGGFALVGEWGLPDSWEDGVAPGSFYRALPGSARRKLEALDQLRLGRFETAGRIFCGHPQAKAIVEPLAWSPEMGSWGEADRIMDALEPHVGRLRERGL